MISLVLTGISRGLGKALHDIFLSKEFSCDQKLFVSRDPVESVEFDRLRSYINWDFSAPDQDFHSMQIFGQSKAIIFINNAGVVAPITRAVNITENALRKSFQVNCFAPVSLAGYLSAVSVQMGIPLLIINISSGAASRPVEGWLAYCSSKAAAKMALDVFSLECPSVTVHHYDPGVMDTNMQAIIRTSSSEDMPDVEKFRAFHSNQKLKAPEAVANEIVKIIRDYL